MLLLAACGAESVDVSGGDPIIRVTAIPVSATNVDTGQHYDSLFVDMIEGRVEEVFTFPAPASIFRNCFVDTDLNGECVDEYGYRWIFGGAASSDDKNGDGADDTISN